MNVVDALVLSIGLDASGFVKGQKETVASLAKTKDAAAKAGKDVEKSAAGMTEGLSKATQGVLTLMAAFLGGKGIKEFIGDASKANTALGNLGASLGVSPQMLSAFGMAAERMGGSARTTQESIRSLSDSLVDFRTQGKNLPNEVWLLQGNSGVNIDTQHGVEAYVDSLAKAANILAKTDPAQADKFLRAIGLDPVTAQLMIQQGPRFKDYVNAMKGIAPSPRDLNAAAQLTDHWSRLNSELSNFATKVGTALTPALDWLADKISAVIDWMAKFVEKHPIWTEAIVGVIGILSAGPILLAIANVGAFAAALAGLGTAGVAAGAGLFGLLGILGAEAGAIGYFGTEPYRNPDAQKGTGLIGLRKHQQDRDEDAGGPLGTVKRALGIGSNRAYHDTTNYTGSNAGALKQAAKELGTSPHDLAMVMAYETSGTFSPHIHGGAGNRYQGLIQFGAEERATYGANDRQSFKEQLPAVVSYLKSRGFKPGMGLADLYSTINAGRPGRYGASDGHGTVMDHVARMRREREGDVQRFLNSPDTSSGAGAKSTSSPTPAPPTNTLWKGGIGGAESALHPRAGAAHVAALSNIANDNRATTTSNSNEMHVANINVNAPQATDAHGIAGGINKALADNMFASHANFGPY